VLSSFHDDLLKGNQIKDLIKVLLQKSGYSVFPYGYESTFSEVRNKLAARAHLSSKKKSKEKVQVYKLLNKGNLQNSDNACVHVVL